MSSGLFVISVWVVMARYTLEFVCHAGCVVGGNCGSFGAIKSDLLTKRVKEIILPCIAPKFLRKTKNCGLC